MSGKVASAVTAFAIFRAPVFASVHVHVTAEADLK